MLQYISEGVGSLSALLAHRDKMCPMLLFPMFVFHLSCVQQVRTYLDLRGSHPEREAFPILLVSVSVSCQIIVVSLSTAMAQGGLRSLFRLHFLGQSLTFTLVKMCRAVEMGARATAENMAPESYTDRSKGQGSVPPQPPAVLPPAQKLRILEQESAS